jgi:hypothetical protein
MQPDQKGGAWALSVVMAAALAGLLFGRPAHAVLPPPSFGRGPPTGVSPAPHVFVLIEPSPAQPEIGILPGTIYPLGGGTRSDVGRNYLTGPPEEKPSPGVPPEVPVVTTPEPGSLTLLSTFILALLVYARLRPRGAATTPCSPAGR